ncbi:hypothetical protein ACRAKI_13340 [Saccharothrix isguenensis]
MAGATVSIEGVTGYNNAIALTRPMHIDDLKHLRDPICSCGPRSTAASRPSPATWPSTPKSTPRANPPTYDTNNNGVIEYDWGAMTGNDADAVSSDRRGGNLDRAETAYVWSVAVAAQQAYALIGDTAKANETQALADRIRTGVVTTLWNPSRQLLGKCGCPRRGGCSSGTARPTSTWSGRAGTRWRPTGTTR